jgi:cytochrome c oxidase assembly factor CtaG
MNVLGGIFIFSVGPIYQYYATLIRTPDMPTVVIDQHYAGAAMDIPGTFIFFTAMMIILGLWLVEDEREAQAEASMSGYR